MAVNEDRSQRTRDKRPRSAATSGASYLRLCRLGHDVPWVKARSLVREPDAGNLHVRFDVVRRYVVDACGYDLVSEGRLALIKRAAGLECALEQLEGRMS
jgi:hypothetical protein